MQAAEIAQAQRDVAWNAALGQPLLPPGTHAEWAALERIESARAAEDRLLKTGSRPTRKVAL